MNRRLSIWEDEKPSSGTGLGRWILPALLVSILLHGLLWLWANRYEVRGMSVELPIPEARKTFRVESVKLDPKTFEPSPDVKRQPAAAPTAIQLPEEKVALGKPVGTPSNAPSAPKLDAATLADHPTVESLSFQSTMQTATDAGVRSLLPDDNAITKELLSDKPVVSGASAVELQDPQNLGGSTITRAGAGSGATQPGFSDLDQLLAQTGPLTPETAPILMPTDLLFDYNAAELRSEALVSLEKLGRLISKNPGAGFVIEGHTDSFGTDEYNTALSLRRADSVKAFLVNVLGLPDGAIETRGLGRSRLIAPATGSIDEQQINRRVEIVIRAAPTP